MKSRCDFVQKNMDTLVTLAGIPIGNHLARTQKGQTILVRPFNVATN